jgi:hypothetical protein
MNACRVDVCNDVDFVKYGEVAGLLFRTAFDRDPELALTEPFIYLFQL